MEHTDVTDEMRDEAHAAAHVDCLACGRETCDAQLTCCCGPAPIRLDRFDVVCCAACLEAVA